MAGAPYSKGAATPNPKVTKSKPKPVTRKGTPQHVESKPIPGQKTGTNPDRQTSDERRSRTPAPLDSSSGPGAPSQNVHVPTIDSRAGLPYVAPARSGTRASGRARATGGGKTSASTAAAATPPPAPNGLDAATRAAILKNFPDKAWMLDDPQLAPILKDFSDGTISADVMAARMKGTDWFRIHGTAATVNQLKDEVNKYLVPMGDTALTDWAIKMSTGQVQPGEFQRYMQEQAKSLYPGLSDAIDRGIDVRTFADPYIQHAAKLLEVAPDSINLTEGKWLAALNQVDPKSGARVSMSLADWDTKLRSEDQYGYKNTKQAKDQAYAMVDNLGKALGATA